MPVTWKTGVYGFVNIRNEKWYVGSGASGEGIEGRRKDHLTKLRKGIHGNSHFQAAWNKYGEKSFRFYVLLRCPPEECVAYEQFWIDEFKAADREHGYNINPCAGNGPGIYQSEETKAKRSATLMGHPVSEASRQKISKAKTGKSLSEEHKAKVARTSTGRTHTVTVEMKLRMSEAAKRRPPMSDETRAKIATANLGRRHSKETLARMSKVQKGHAVSDETRRKIGEKSRGQVQSEGARAKNAAAQRKRYEDPMERQRTALLTSQAIMASAEMRANRVRAGKCRRKQDG